MCESLGPVDELAVVDAQLQRLTSTWHRLDGPVKDLLARLVRFLDTVLLVGLLRRRQRQHILSRGIGALLANFDLGSKMSSVASLAGIKSGKDLNIEKLTSNLRVAPTGIQADNFVAILPTIGNLTGAGTVDSKNALDFKMLATLGAHVSP